MFFNSVIDIKMLITIRKDILNSDVDFYVINHDGCKLLEKEIIAKKFGLS